MSAKITERHCRRRDRPRVHRASHRASFAGERGSLSLRREGLPIRNEMQAACNRSRRFEPNAHSMVGSVSRRRGRAHLLSTLRASVDVGPRWISESAHERSQRMSRPNSSRRQRRPDQMNLLEARKQRPRWGTLPAEIQMRLRDLLVRLLCAHVETAPRQQEGEGAIHE